MNETSKRIKAYKEALPHLRERVAGVALLLVMSLVMMTSASFAWFTLSKAPEVSSAATTVAANGNLEIALSNTDGDTPLESRVGDSAASESGPDGVNEKVLPWDVTDANLTWGNMINLSDASYGLDNLVLRPAMLGNATELLIRPLTTVNYGADGRAEANYNSELAFTNWDTEFNKFAYSTATKYGVRAISTLEYDIPDAIYSKYSALKQEYNNAVALADNIYQNQLLTDANITVLADLISDYMMSNIGDGDGNFDIAAADVQKLYNMMVMLEQAYKAAGEALANVINIEYFNAVGVNNYAALEIDEGDLWTMTETELFSPTVKGQTVTIEVPSSYKRTVGNIVYQYKEDVTTLQECIAYMLNTYYVDSTWQGAEWADLETYVNELVVIKTCTVIPKGEAETPVSSLGGSYIAQNSMNLMRNGVDAYIKEGLIVNFESMAGTYMNASTKITASGISIKANSIRTYAHSSKNDAHTLTDDINKYYNVAALGTSAQVVAQDTYGMVVDFWVRTNAPESCLMLEGNVVTITNKIPATKLVDGKEVALYSATVTYEEVDEEGNPLTETVDVYYLDPNETPDDPSDDVAHFADTSGLVWHEVEVKVDETTTTTETQLTRGVKIEISESQKIIEEIEVVGYEGANRIWDDETWDEADKLSVNSTTQGSGSCYVFYADNPADQQNSLNLLANLRVAFLDESGVLLVKGKLNTKQAYAESGKVTVPLELFEDTTTSNTTYTADGDLAILALDQNTPAWLTMIVYLEGTELSNQDVLAAGEINGKLNVQFGTSEALVAMGDETLQQQEVYVTAELQGGTEFNYGEGDATVDVYVTVEGAEPSTVTGFFVRQINATQGTRQEAKTFTPTGTPGVYKATFTFDAPGTYVFRAVTLDGQEHDLNQIELPTVVVNGFAIRSIECGAVGDGNTAYVLSESSSYSTSLALEFAATQANESISSVQLQFVENDTGEAVTTKLAYNASEQKWKGNARFLHAGTYTLSYVIMDGEYTELESFRYQLQLVLGVYATITDDQDGRADGRNYVYTGTSFPVALKVKLFDGNNQELFNIGQVNLNYKRSGSTLDDGLYDALDWSDSSESHEGNFQLENPGIFVFDNVTVTVNGTTSAITKTKGSVPSYTVMTPEPPAYYDHNTDDYQLAISTTAETAVFSVLMDNAESLSGSHIAAFITDGSGTEHKVYGTKGTDVNGHSCFTFAIPRSNTTGQEGVWTLTRLECYNGYDADTNTLYSASNPLELDVEDITVTVQVPKIEVASIADVQLGGGGDNGTYYFGESVTADTSKIKITVTDQAGNALNANQEEAKVNNITAQYIWETYSDQLDSNNAYKTRNGLSYGGGYTTTTETSVGATPLTLANYAEDNSVFTPRVSDSTSMTLTVAGYYYCNQIKVTIGNAVYTIGSSNTTVTIGTTSTTIANVGTPLSHMPAFAFKTEVPTVEISDISPTGTLSYDEANSGVTDTVSGWNRWGTQATATRSTAHKHQVANAAFNDSYNATVYFSCDHSSGATYTVYGAFWQAVTDYHNYTRPKVTLNLAGISTGMTAELEFGVDVQLYNDTTKTTGYSWTANGTCVRNVGGYTSKSASSDEKTPAGEITASTLAVTYNSRIFNFPIPTITINNPW